MRHILFTFHSFICAGLYNNTFFWKKLFIKESCFFAFLTVETFVNFPLFETAVSAFQLKVTLSTFTEFTFTFFGAVLSTDFTVTVTVAFAESSAFVVIMAVPVPLIVKLPLEASIVATALLELLQFTFAFYSGQCSCCCQLITLIFICVIIISQICSSITDLNTCYF